MSEIENPEETIQEEVKPKKKKSSFEIKSDNPKILKTVVETLGAIIDEAQIQVLPKALIIKAMDPSRICLMKLELGKPCFDVYKIKGTSKIGVNLDALDKILKRSTSSDAITRKYDDSTNKIKIQMKQEGRTRAKNFSLFLIDLDIEEIPLENLEVIEYQSSWNMKPDFLLEAIKDAEIYAEILAMKTDDETGLELSAIGQLGEMDYQLETDDLIEPDLAKASGTYSITFLKSILKLSSITEQMKISLKDDHPLSFKFSLLEGGTVDFWLAPRVEQEDEFDDEMDDF